MKKSFIKFITIALLGVAALSMTGCMQPVEPKTIVTAESNETMFVIPLQGENRDAQAKLDSANYYSKKKVAVKEFQIPHRWLNVGRFEWSYDGRWVPTVRVIKVNRAPRTVEFSVDDKNAAKKDADAIWLESSDSVGFSTGFSLSAMIEEEEASNFLYRYPAGDLSVVLKTEVRARIQQIASGFAARYNLDSLRAKKNEMLDEVRKDVIPFFKERGITITTIGQFGGMTYENPQIQQAIDKVFIAQQEKETAKAALDAVKDINLRSEAEAKQKKDNEITLATGKAEAIRLEAEAIAKGNLLKAQADASGIEAVSKATQIASSNPLFLEVRKLDVQTKMYEKWTGQVPSTVIAGGGVNPNIFLPTTSAVPESTLKLSASTLR